MKISGQVLDKNNEPLASANITLRSGAMSGKTGVVANLDGEFSMESDAIEPSSLFEVSYIGFISQNWTALSLQDKKINLQDSIEPLEEIVITRNKKPASIDSSKNKSKISLHLKKYKFAYAGGILLASILLISKIKK